MTKTFSEGFMQDLVTLLEYCVENNTDNVELNFDINGRELQVDIAFSIKEAGGMNESELS